MYNRVNKIHKQVLVSNNKHLFIAKSNLLNPDSEINILNLGVLGYSGQNWVGGFDPRISGLLDSA